MKKFGLFLTSSAFLAAGSLQAQLAFTDSYTQNFNTLPTTGTTTVLNLEGWLASDNTIAASDGSATSASAPTGSMSFGVTGSTERALGGQSATAVPVFGLQLVNESDAAITTLAISYYIETWRIGAALTTSTTAIEYQKFDFAYSLDATSLTSGTYTNFDSLDGVSTRQINRTTSTADSNFVASITPVNGNATENRALVSANLTLSSAWQPGTMLTLRWSDFNDSGFDSGIGIDDLTVTAVPEPVHYGMMMAGLLGVIIWRRQRSRRDSPAHS